jgi:hypothetical protein
MLDLSPDDRVILDRILTQLAGRLDGAIDFWTLVCLEGDLSQREEFLAHHREIMHSLVVVVRELFKGTPWAESQAVANWFEAMSNACHKVLKAFITLEQFRRVPLTEVRRATEMLAEGYRELQGTIQQLGTTANLTISYWRGPTAAKEEHYQRILRGLFDLCCQARGPEQPAAAVSSSGG